MSTIPSVQLSVHLPKAAIDSVLSELIAPLVRELVAVGAVSAAYFQRFVKPDWNVALTLANATGAATGTAECRLAAGLDALRRNGIAASWGWLPPEPFPDELGGPAARPSVERIFHHDSECCVRLIDRERAGRSGRSRREFSVLVVERMLDLFRFDRDERIAFYRQGYRLPFEQGTWDDADRALLDERYGGVRQALASLLDDSLREDADACWGSELVAAIGRGCLAAARPHVESLRSAAIAGMLPVGLVPLASEICRRHGNRLGIDGLGEAILRYYLCRLHEERRIAIP